MTIKINDMLPDMSVVTTSNDALQLSSLQGKNVVIYFYPKDNTPGCTTQGQDFSAAYADFQNADTEIFGVSRESIRSHQNFINKYQFPFDLISDPDETLCHAFEVIKEKNMYGRKYLGIERSTFVFNRQGKLIHEVRKVKVKGHVADILALVQSL